jgi:hypothetical protein
MLCSVLNLQNMLLHYDSGHRISHRCCGADCYGRPQIRCQRPHPIIDWSKHGWRSTIKQPQQIPIDHTPWASAYSNHPFPPPKLQTQTQITKKAWKARHAEGIISSCDPIQGKACFFLITQYIRDTHNAHTLIPMYTRTQTLLLGASSKTLSANPQDWRSHRRRLAVDGNITYHWKHKCC